MAGKCLSVEIPAYQERFKSAVRQTKFVDSIRYAMVLISFVWTQLIF